MVDSQDVERPSSGPASPTTEIEDKLREAFKALFAGAGRRGGLEFVHTLVRTGFYDARPIEDPVLRVKRRLDSSANVPSEAQASVLYCELAAEPVPLEVIANLLRCERGERYRVIPFERSKSGSYWEQAAVNAEYLAEALREAGHTDLGEAVHSAYLEQALSACTAHQDEQVHVVALNDLRTLLKVLLEVYDLQRMSFRDAGRYERHPLGVVEFLINNELGLCGWRLHGLHRAIPFFERKPEGMDGRNYMVNGDTEIEYWGTQLEPPGGIWTVNGKRLHELGLRGRYNLLGQWQPILYPGWPEDLEALVNEVGALSPDIDVVGALFYVYATGYRTLEFVVRTNVELPYEMGTIGHVIHLWRCPVPSGRTLGTGERLYDGWVELESVEPEYVRSAIAAVGVALNRLAFAYDASLAWRVKYRPTPSGRPIAKPTPDDVGLFNKLLTEFPEDDDAILLEASLEWYRHALAEANPFSAFFDYYVAIERVAVAIHDGRAHFGLGYTRMPKDERRRERADCIRQKHDAVYQTDPELFVRDAYFDCVVGLGKKVREVCELVFGAGHPYVTALFQKEDGYSLSDIRSGIAHGSLSQADRDHLDLVARRLPAIADISKEFLGRLSFRKVGGEALPGWSQQYLDERPPTDPRTFIATSDPDLIFSNDWTIQPHWCG